MASDAPNWRPGFEPYFLHGGEPERTKQFCAETLDTSRAAWGPEPHEQPTAGKEAEAQEVPAVIQGLCDDIQIWMLHQNKQVPTMCQVLC